VTLASTWDEVELPLLQEIGRAEIEDRPPEIFAFFEQRRIPPARAAAVIERLRADDLIDGVSKALGPPRLRTMANVHLTADGARAAGMWPSGERYRIYRGVGGGDGPRRHGRASHAARGNRPRASGCTDRRPDADPGTGSGAPRGRALAADPALVNVAAG
jgi:hypothetical protein